ncbi:two component transcriptional regulator, winged helix family [Trichodesmium erythraeum IMS101]|uniref:Two component transcriptional regulator, winged helix family n=1 Tax=Trichodesmium erythraeum (strain IMS101) TaxID=203124 RepID=Q118G2_TRIEI|nr:response regulator transcription factor [Trichodesmium erythraeum GBRTRLIN201]
MGDACILIVEGNVHLRSLLAWHLQQSKHLVHQSADVDHAKKLIYAHCPSLVILETDLPDGNSFEFCQWLQQQQQCLILMLSSRKTEADIVAGLKSGADDYITKPFGMQEFMARIEALLRRRRSISSTPPISLDYGDLIIDLVHRRVIFKGNLIDLTPQEFNLLYVLAQAEGIPLSRSELLHRGWPDSIDNPRTIDTHVLSLRKKIEIDPRQPSLIQTVRNVGYRFNREILTIDQWNNNYQKSYQQPQKVAPA